MKVIKRDGKSEAVSLDKLKARLSKLAYGLNTDFVDTVCVCGYVLVCFFRFCFELNRIVSLRRLWGVFVVGPPRRILTPLLHRLVCKKHCDPHIFVCLLTWPLFELQRQV